MGRDTLQIINRCPFCGPIGFSECKFAELDRETGCIWNLGGECNSPEREEQNKQMMKQYMEDAECY